MNIRISNQSDIDSIVDIWYSVSITAHSFIDPKYWEASKHDMKNTYLPQAETYVIEDSGIILGFVSMVDNYLAALFIKTEFQGNGYGEMLLNYIKESRDTINLKAYVKNNKAINFYIKNMFKVQQVQNDKNVNESEYIMIWNR